MIIEMTDKEYFEVKAINSSMLKTLYFESAKHLDFNKESKSLSTGKLFHRYLLEPELFKKTTVLQPEFFPISKEMKEKYSENMENYSRTKEFRDKKQAFDDSIGDRTLVSKSELETLENMKNSILESKELYNLFLTGGKAEVVINQEIDIKGKKYSCKVKLDYLIIGNIVYIIDVKSTKSASYNNFKRDIIKYGYDIQAAFYHDIIRKYLISIPEAIDINRIEFIWLAIETSAPYGFAWYECSQQTFDYGRDKYMSVIEEARRVIETGEKAGYRASYEVVPI